MVTSFAPYTPFLLPQDARGNRILVCDFSQCFTMIHPSEVQALRCQMMTKLWNKYSSLEPMLVLLGEILAYVPPHVLTLNCPMEEIVLGIEREPEFIFVYADIVYGIFVGKDTINLRIIHPWQKDVKLAKSVAGTAQFYYDLSTCHLFVLHDDGTYPCGGASLLDYDVKAGVIHKSYRLPGLYFFSASSSIKLAVLGGHLFILVSWFKHLELFHRHLDSSQDLALIWSTYDVIQESFNYHLTVVSHTPIILRVHYETIEGFVMTTLQRSLLSFAYTPKTVVVLPEDSYPFNPIQGSTFCRYGSDDSFKLWDCKVRSRPPEDDEGEDGLEYHGLLFDCPAATDGSGKIYYVFGKRVEVDNNVYKQSTRLIRAYTYLKNE